MPAQHSESNLPTNPFEIKSGPVHLPILKLLSHDLGLVSARLKEKVGQAPDFFKNAPMVIDLHDLDEPEADIDFSALARLMRDCGLVPVGVCGGSEQQIQAARRFGLSLLTQGRHEAAAAKPAEAKPQAESIASKLVDQPVRSGQRIYATGSDLIVLAAVSAGAEIMADGNIHVYGALRGRALAGVQGNQDCRIFCHDLQAELVAISGHYKVSENIDDSVRGQPVQIYLKDNALIIEMLAA
jgi:septum site-determining protein MinC